MKIISSIVIFLSMVFLGISSKKNVSAEQEKSNIVVIVEGYPRQNEISIWSTMSIKMPPPLYILDNFNIHDFSDGINDLRDTIVYTSTDNQVLLKYRCNDFYESEIVLQCGDTVFISFKDQFPLRYKNSVRQHTDSLVWESMTENTRNPKVNAMLEYMVFPAIVNSSRFIGSTERKDTLRANAITEVNAKNELLHSLYENREIDSLLYQVKIKNSQLDMYFLQLSENRSKEECMEILRSIQQGDVKSHIKEVCHVADFYIKKIITDNQALVPDDRYIDFINSSLFVPEVRDYLFYNYIKNKAEQLGLAEVKELHGKFAEKAVLRHLVEQIEAQYFPFDSSFSKSEFISLMTMDNTTLSLNAVLEKHRGKIFYIDFWASWCISCLEQMPFADTLQQNFENEQIVFINISIDKNVEHWKNSVLNNGLADQEHNYLFIDYSNSKWAEGVKLHSIPRYMILDSEGNILVNSALSPKEILRKPEWLYGQIEDNL